MLPSNRTRRAVSTSSVTRIPTAGDSSRIRGSPSGPDIGTPVGVARRRGAAVLRTSVPCPQCRQAPATTVGPMALSAAPRAMADDDRDRSRDVPLVVRRVVPLVVRRVRCWEAAGSRRPSWGSSSIPRVRTVRSRVGRRSRRPEQTRKGWRRCRIPDRSRRNPHRAMTMILHRWATGLMKTMSPNRWAVTPMRTMILNRSSRQMTTPNRSVTSAQALPAATAA
jgi:hypothetical protein